MASEDKDTKKIILKNEETQDLKESKEPGLVIGDKAEVKLEEKKNLEIKPKQMETTGKSADMSKTGRTSPDRSYTNNRDRSKGKGKFGRRPNRGADELEKRIVTIRRVSHTYKGGKRMSLSVLVVVGDRKGKVGAAMGKGADVKSAETKAYNKAKKSMVEIKLHNTTIPHELFHKKGAVKIFMKPAAPGTGVIAGASMRSVLELVGIKDILTKIIGAPNPITNVYATIEALQSMKP